MKKLSGFAFVALALACMYSPIGCFARKKALQERHAESSSAVEEIRQEAVTSIPETSATPTAESPAEIEVPETSTNLTEILPPETPREPITEESVEPSVEETFPTYSENETEHDNVPVVESTTAQAGSSETPAVPTVSTGTTTATEPVTERPTEKATTVDPTTTTAPQTEPHAEACMEHDYVATKTVPQTRVGSFDDLGYTVFTCSICGHTAKGDYEGYLDCSWRYQKVNEYRTGPGRFLLSEDGSVIYFNKEGCVQLQPFTRAEGLESIARLRAQQEAYDMNNEGTLNHFHNGYPSDYYYGSSYWGGLNCECCQAGGVELEHLLDATFREEEEAPYARQGHLRIVLNESLKYIGIGAYVYKGAIVVVCECSDIPQ